MIKSSATPAASYKDMWQLRHYGFFEGLAEHPLERHPDKSSIAVMMAGAALFCSNAETAKKTYTKANQLAQQPKDIKKFMLATLYIQLAKTMLLAGKPEQAIEKFSAAWQLGNELLLPMFYDFMCAEAEQLLVAGNTRAAIQAWQDIATVLQQDTPEHVYHRLSHCYSVNSMGFGGTNEENQQFGDAHKHDVLEYFHSVLQPELYFEIGVDEGLSLIRAKKSAIGVDARPQLNLKVELPQTSTIYGLSSDAFFQLEAATAFTQPAALAFIDGMHLFEFALRDFMNFERFAAPYSLLVIDDVFPGHPLQARRRRQSNSWTGDIWKLIPVLQRYRPDLTLIALNSAGTGLLLVAGLDNTNTVLFDHYQAIVAEFQPEQQVPEHIVLRQIALASNHVVVAMLLNILKQAADQNQGKQQVSQALAGLQPMLELAMKATSSTEVLSAIVTEKQQQVINEAAMLDVQLFLPQAIAPEYSEANSIRKKIKPGQWQTVEFTFCQELPAQPLRLDPAAQSGVFEINHIELQNLDSGEYLLQMRRAADFQRITVTGDSFVVDPTTHFMFFSYANDPILYLPAVRSELANFKLKVSLRAISDAEEIKSIWALYKKEKS